MDAFQAYTYSTSTWLFLQAVPLLMSPKLIINLLSSDDPRRPTDLESYLSRTLALTLLALAALTTLLSGLLPLTSLTADSEHSPYAGPATFITMTFHVAHGVYCYILWNSMGSLGFLLGLCGDVFLAAWGLWCLVFGSASHGQGEARVSGWPFRNEVERKAKREKTMAKKVKM